jgi:hypothetical protein
MRIENNGIVSISTITPAISAKLQVHDELANQDAGIVLINALADAGNLRGTRFRFLNSDLSIINCKATGKINFATNFNTRMIINATGNVGTGMFTPGHKLDIVNTDNTNGININHSGTGVQGLDIELGFVRIILALGYMPRIMLLKTYWGFQSILQVRR